MLVFNPALMSNKFQVSGLPTAFAVDGSFGGAGATGHSQLVLFFAIAKRRQIRNFFIKFKNSRIKTRSVNYRLTCFIVVRK